MINANISKWPLKILLRLLFTLALDDVPLAFASSQMIYASVWLGWIAWPFLWQKDQHLSVDRDMLHSGIASLWTVICCIVANSVPTTSVPYWVCLQTGNTPKHCNFHIFSWGK